MSQVLKYDRVLDLNQVSIEIAIPDELLDGVSDSDRYSLHLFVANEAIMKIKKRTQDNNRQVGGSGFKGYSEEYKESEAYEAYNKSSSVNMTLTGDMMGALDILSVDESKAVIGFRDETNIKKAYNHNVGDTVPKREFFGLNGKELSELNASIQGDIEQFTESRQTELLAEDIVSEFFTSSGANIATAEEVAVIGQSLFDSLFEDLGIF